MNWYLKVFKQYTDFSGRARRTEYWMFVLFHVLAIIATMVIDTLLGLTMMSDSYYGLLYLIYVIISFVPALAVSVRRLHDIGKSGWYYLINFIPLIGPLWFLVYACTDGEAKTNKWGPNPKGIGHDSAINQIGTE